MAETSVQLSEEIYFQNNTATLFHRTNNLDTIDDILKNGWSDSGSGYYGRGIYTNYKLENQVSQSMRHYGPILLKLKYTNIKNLLFFTPSLAKKVHPDGYTLKEQFDKLFPKHGISDTDFKTYQSMVDTHSHSAGAAKALYEKYSHVADHLHGIEYVGGQDGPCILIYPPAKDTILLAAADVTNVVNPENVEWMTITAARKLGPKIFGKGLYSPEKHSLTLVKPTDKDSVVKKLAALLKLPTWDISTTEDLLNMFPARQALEIVNKQVRRYGYPYSNSTLSYIPFLEKVKRDPDTFTLLLQSALSYDSAPDDFVTHILNYNRQDINFKHIKMIVEKYPSALPKFLFFNKVITLLHNQPDVILFLFDEFEKDTPQVAIYKDRYGSTPSIIESTVINSDLDTIKQVFPKFKSVYETYGKDVYLKLIWSSLSIRNNRISGYDVTNYLLELFDGPNHDLLSSQDFSFVTTHAFGSNELRNYLIGYIASYKTDFAVSIENAKDIVKYLVSSKNFVKLKKVFDDISKPAKSELFAISMVGEFLSKNLQKEEFNTLFGATNDFIKYLPSVVIGSQNYNLHRYLETISYDEQKMDLAFQAFANVNYKLDKYQINGAISFAFLSVNDTSKVTRFLKTLFKHRSIFDYNSIDFYAIFSDTDGRNKSSVVMDIIYSIDPTFFSTIPDKKSFVENFFEKGRGSEVAMKLLMPPINLIDASNINLTKLLRSSFGNNTYIPDYFYQFIIRNDKLFSNDPTNEVNKPFILHLLTTEYYPEVIKKITALNPSFISSLSTLDFEKTNFSNLDTANIPTITGMENMYAGYMSILDGLKNNPSLKSISLYDLVQSFTKKFSTRLRPDRFVEFVKKLMEVKGKDLDADTTDIIFQTACLKSGQTNSELIVNGVGLSQVLLELMNSINPSYIKVIDSSTWIRMYVGAKNKSLIFDYAMNSDMLDSYRIAEMYSYTPVKEKGEFVKKVFANPKIEFDASLVKAFLQDTYTPEIAKLLLDRAVIDKWPAEDVAEMFSGNKSYKNTQVQSYVNKRLIPRINQFTDDDVDKFVDVTSADRILLFLFKVKRNLNYRQTKKILTNLEDLSMYNSAKINSLFKTASRYHDNNILGYTFNIVLDLNYSKEIVVDSLISVLKTLPNISNGLIRSVINTIVTGRRVPHDYYYVKILDTVLTHKKDIDSDTLFVFLNEYAQKTPEANDAVYYKFFEKVFKRKSKLTDRDVAVLLTHIPTYETVIKEPPLNIYNTIFNIISRSGFSVRDTYHLCQTGDKMFGMGLMESDQLLKYLDRIIEKQKEGLTAQHVYYLMSASTDAQHTVDTIKKYIALDSLKKLIDPARYNVVLQEDLIKYSEYFMGTLNETMTPASQMDMDKAFDVFDASYKKTTGKSWDKEKFISRAYNWVFFGDDKGYVAVRPQRGGMIKLVGVAGNPKSVLSGFREMTSHYANTPIWGAVSLDIADMTVRVDANFKKLTVPGGVVGSMIFNVIKSKIPASVFGGAVIKQANADGTITFDYPDVGEANKVLIGNKEYFEVLKGMIMNDPKLAPYQSILNKLL